MVEGDTHKKRNLSRLSLLAVTILFKLLLRCSSVRRAVERPSKVSGPSATQRYSTDVGLIPERDMSSFHAAA